jgi:hypothetical protein
VVISARLIERLGVISKNNQGSLMEVVEYNNARDIWVKFEKGKPVHTSWFQFIRGKVANVYDKNIYGVGYLGEGKYKTWENGITPQYITWHDMLKRCYSDTYKEKRNTYSDCTVTDEWHNFQNFAKWFDKNYYEIEGQRMHLDKDILRKGNRVYSPETCVFVPQFINGIFIKCNSKRGNLPIGVSFIKQSKKYKVECSKGKGKNVFLGNFTSPHDAFEAYKSHKEKYIKEVADEHKDRIPTRLYDAMMRYKVEIND